MSKLKDLRPNNYLLIPIKTFEEILNPPEIPQTVLDQLEENRDE